MTKEDRIAMAGEAGFPDCKPENHAIVSSAGTSALHGIYRRMVVKISHPRNHSSRKIAKPGQ